MSGSLGALGVLVVQIPLHRSRTPIARECPVPTIVSRLAGDLLFPLVKRIPITGGDPFFVPGGDLYPHRTDSDRRRLRARDSLAPDRLRTRHPPHQTKGAGNRQRDPPARTANLPCLAARRLFPAYRKKRPPPSPSFYGRVNNFENFPRLTDPACRTRRSASKAGAASPKAAERVRTP
jgi:hypothetical protein